MPKKILYLFLLLFLLTACSGTVDSVKRGLLGQKENSTDEFLVEKKDPLILPPKFEDLPTPSDALNSETAEDDSSIFEQSLGTMTEDDGKTSSSESTEESILKKIRKK